MLIPNSDSKRITRYNFVKELVNNGTMNARLTKPEILSHKLGFTLLLGITIQSFVKVSLQPFNHLTLVHKDAFNNIQSTEG